MWGCLGRLLKFFAGSLLALALVIALGWWYIGTSSFEGLIKARIESTLETRLGRDVSIGSLQIVRGRPEKVVLNDLRIANAPGGVHPYFATVKQVVITGGIDSFWGRRINVGRIDVVNPTLYFEIYPAGSKLVHNFPHWESGPKSKYDIYHLTMGKMYVRGATVDFLDRKHDLAAVATNLASDITITSAANRYAGTLTGDAVRMRIQEYVPFDLDLRGGFVYEPNRLTLQSIAMRGHGMEVFLRGKLEPLADGAYDLNVDSRMTLARVREIFKINKTLDGTIALASTLKGKQGEFVLAGGWSSPKIVADVYDLANLKGHLNVTAERAVVDVDKASYGGGTIAAHYVLPQFAEPYPQDVELRYNGVSLEKLFSDWGTKDTGLRGGATGKLVYHWNKDRVLAGNGEGTATLARNAMAFSNAKYPIPLGGSADFALDNGTVIFRRGELTTEASTIGFRGKLRIEDLYTDLLLNITSKDFSELDRAAFNFAHSAGKKTYELLGLGGSGTMTGSVVGKLKTPQVVARIAATNTKYNNVDLGDSQIDLKYDGAKSVLTFERATFHDTNGTLALTGTVAFPDRGPSPVFDLAVDASHYPIDKAMATVNLKLAATGIGTGKLVVTGSPDAGRVHFANLDIRDGNARLILNGDVAWKPGKGNIDFDLDIDAQNYSVTAIAKFLDLGTVPVTGDVTGKLHLAGPKSSLGGAGAVTVRHGTIYGEPVNVASANIAFTEGTLKATNVRVEAPAGTITGQAELNLNTNQFNYTIESSSIDLSKLKALSSLAGLLGGNIKLSSTGAGTFDQPEVVLEATLNQATLKGLTLPPDVPPPTVYLAIRNGRLIVRGSIGNLLTIDGDGSVAPDSSLDGLVRITISDLAKLLSISPNTASIPASGNLVIEAKLGGKLSSIEAVRVDATVPVLNLHVSEHEFVAAQPLRIGMRDGRIVFDSFQLQLAKTQSTLAVTGFAELTGAKRLNVDVRGLFEAVLAQLFVPGLRADGHIIVAGGVHGTLSDPRLTGTAEFQDASIRFAGFPQIIDHLTGTLVFREDRIEIDSLRAQVGGGNVVVGGFVTLNGLKPQRARVTLQGTEVAIRYFEGLTVEGNFNLVLSGDMDRFVLAGDVNVLRATYYKDFDFRQSLLNVVLSRRGVTPVVAASWQDRVSLRVRLSAPDTLAVRNNIADVTATADLDLTGTLANPVVIGLVTLDEGGRVRFNNVDYRLVRGSINFQNPFRIDPYFDVTFEGRVSGGVSEIESGPLDVSINITGTLDRISPTITSDPPASDITLFSLLGFGALTNQRNQPTNVDASVAGRGLITQSIVNALGSKLLPFADSFSYDPGLLDTTGDPGPKVTFEKRLSNDLRVVVVYKLNDQKNKEVIEWQVTPDWTLQFTRDEPRNEYRLEGRFRRQYQGHWTLGGRRDGTAMFASLGSIATPPPPAPEPEPESQTTSTQLPPGPHVPSAQVPYDGRTVTRIDFRSDGGFDTTALAQYLALKVGEPITLRAVQSSIRSLFATGDFRDIRVDAVADGDGAAVTFVLSLNYRIGSITFDGLAGTKRTRAEHELTVHTGDVASLSAVDHSAVAVQQYLTRTGYLDAAVDPETTFVRERNRADVIFHVDAGTRATVATVNLDGDLTPFAASELILQMTEKPGAAFDLAEARSDADRIRRYLMRKEYRKADVRYVNYTYDAAAKRVTLNYRVTVGPIVKVAVEGVSRGAVRGLLPFRPNQRYSEDAIDRAANDIVTAFQQRGYFNAAVDTESKLEGNIWTTTFIVNPGPRFRLTAVTFTGNARVSDKTLAGVVTTSPSAGFIRNLAATIFRRPTGVTRAQLSADRDAIESYYRLQGFSEATVATPVAQTHPDGTLTVNFPITEGPQTLLADVHVEGNQQVATSDLPLLQLKAGQPLNPQLEREDLVALQTFYADRGNAEVQVTPRVEVSPDKTKATLSYVVAEGPKIKVDEIVVRGNSYTKSNVILRKSGLDRGDPFSYTSILEAQRNLYRLGIFSRVDIQAEQTGTSLADRNLVIQVDEGKDLTVAGSVGGSSGITRSDNRFSPLGSVSVANRNLFGTGRYAGIETIISNERQELYLTYREPFIGKYDVPVQFTIFQSDDVRQGVHLRQRGTFIEASRVGRFGARWSARYEYRINNCIKKSDDDLCAQAEQALIPGLDRSFTDISISSITPTVFWDKRDDPIDPHRGFFTSASIEYAFPLFSANAGFTKEFVQGAWYLPLTQRSVFAFSGRLGLIQPLAHDKDGNLAAVPLSERFTGGGESSHRAFRLDELGTVCLPEDTGCKATLVRLPNGQIAAIGGNALFVANAEYRFPIFSSVGGAVFADVGNVYKDAIALNDMRYGVGTGVRYLSPVGPLRFDVGYKLNRRIIGRDDSGKAIYESPFAYFITLGYAF